MATASVNIRRLDREELPGFRTYLLPETVRALEEEKKELLALGVVTGRHACAACAARIVSSQTAELTDLFVDEAARRRGVGRILLNCLMEQLAREGISRLDADYVLRGEGLAAMDALFSQLGFSAPRLRSRVFLAPSARFHKTPWLRKAFSHRYRTPAGIEGWNSLPAGAAVELEQAEDIPDFLSWGSLKDRALPELSVALLQGERIAAYLLAGESADGGCVLLAGVRRKGAPPTAFLALLSELINRCYYRFGGDFPFYFSALTPRVETLARRLMGEGYTEYEEHTCARQLDHWPGSEEQEV